MMQQKLLRCRSPTIFQQKCEWPACAPWPQPNKFPLKEYFITLPSAKDLSEDFALASRAMEVAYEAKASPVDEAYGDEDYTLGGKMAYPGSSTPRGSRGNAFFRRGGGRANNRVPMRGANRSRGRGKRPSNGDSSGGESDGGGYGPGMDAISNGNGGRGGRRRTNQRPVGSAQLSGRGRGGNRGRGAGRARGRIGRGLSQAAEALLGMGGEYDQDEAMTVSNTSIIIFSFPCQDLHMHLVCMHVNTATGRAAGTHSTLREGSRADSACSCTHRMW